MSINQFYDPTPEEVLNDIVVSNTRNIKCNKIRANELNVSLINGFPVQGDSLPALGPEYSILTNINGDAKFTNTVNIVENAALVIQDGGVIIANTGSLFYNDAAVTNFSRSNVVSGNQASFNFENSAIASFDNSAIALENTPVNINSSNIAVTNSNITLVSSDGTNYISTPRINFKASGNTPNTNLDFYAYYVYGFELFRQPITGAVVSLNKIIPVGFVRVGQMCTMFISAFDYSALVDLGQNTFKLLAIPYPQELNAFAPASNVVFNANVVDTQVGIPGFRQDGCVFVYALNGQITITITRGTSEANSGFNLVNGQVYGLGGNYTFGDLSIDVGTAFSYLCLPIN